MAKENGAPNTEMTGTPAYSKQIIDIADFLYKHPNRGLANITDKTYSKEFFDAK